jgi:hypothetical protein
VRDPIYYGKWADRRAFLSFQDVVIGDR